MNFDDTPQEAEFRATARKWMDANAPFRLVTGVRMTSTR